MAELSLGTTGSLAPIAAATKALPAAWVRLQNIDALRGFVMVPDAAGSPARDVTDRAAVPPDCMVLATKEAPPGYRLAKVLLTQVSA